MKIVFVHPEIDNIGVEYLSAVLKQGGHQTELVFDPMLFMDSVLRIPSLHDAFRFNDMIIEDVVEKKPDMVCFSVISDNYSWACDVARELKSRLDVPIIFGGIHPTSVPEIVMKNDFVDFLVIGEGEHALLDLANALERKMPVHGIKNVWSRSGKKIIRSNVRPLVGDLDELPFPDKGIFNEIVPRFFDRYSTITSRGCPFSCSYCNNSFLKKLYKGAGTYLRRRSVDNVILELKKAKSLGFRKIIFHDETFNHDMKWLEEFSWKYKKEIGLPFFCWINPSLVKREAVMLLKEAGCTCVEIGIQTHNPDIGRDVLKRRCSERDSVRAIELFMKENIYVITDNMIGLPLQGKDDLLEIIDFYNKTRADFMQMYWLRYFPKTEIVNISKNLGILDDDMVSEIEESRNTNFFTHGGDTFDRELGKIVNMFYLLNVLPSRITRFMARQKMYRLLPSKNMYPVMLFARKPKEFLSRRSKKRINFTGNKTGHFPRFYAHYMKKKVLHVVRQALN